MIFQGEKSITEVFKNNQLIFFIVLGKVRDSLLARGTTTIRGLGRTFKIMDNGDGNRKIDKEEFYWGLKD